MIFDPILKTPHAFSTRVGGFSGAEFSSLNLSDKTGDDPETVLRNQAVFLDYFNNPSRAFLNQIHGSDIHIVDKPGSYLGDGLITSSIGLLLTVTTADCYPVLINDPLKNAVAALHAGWRGVKGEILPKCLAIMQKTFSSSPEDLKVAIGPGIRQNRFQVGVEVVEAFGDAGAKFALPDESENGKFFLDLESILIQQAVQNGVKASNISTSGICTFDDPRFFSHRRDHGKTGRMWAGIMLE